MNEIPKYNEWNHNTRPAGECIMVSWVVFWDFMNVFENLVLKPRVGHGIFDLHNNCNPNTLCGEWYLDNVLWKLTSGIWKLYYENSLYGEWYLENVLWKLTSEIWKLYYENSLCGEWDMNHISLCGPNTLQTTSRECIMPKMWGLYFGLQCCVIV